MLLQVNFWLLYVVIKKVPFNSNHSVLRKMGWGVEEVKVVV